MQRSSKYYPLKWFVECKPGSQAFYETIAAFNSEEVAKGYAKDCAAANGDWTAYRVLERTGSGTKVVYATYRVKEG